ncbi:MAG: IS256 family transposase [Deltaproteobacteria bacterium]
MLPKRSVRTEELLGEAKTQEDLFGPGGVLKRLSGALMERMLRAELSEHLEQEKALGFPNRRNGTSEKTVRTEHGETRLEIPRDREARFEPKLVPKHVTRVNGLDEKILALYSRGLSTRDIQDELSELYGTEISPALVSRVTDEVQEELAAWQGRQLDPVYPVIWLDALVVKMRHDGTVQNRAVHVVIGLNTEGRKEVLGLWVETNEGAKFWMRVLSDLQARGVQDVLIACCDGLKGFPAAIEAVFPQAMVQTCIVHQVRHSLSFVGWKDRKQVAAALRAIYTAENEPAARDRLDDFEREWGGKFPMIVSSWRANWLTLTAFLAFPLAVRKLIYTTNAIESLNYQLRKVIKTKGSFPTETAVLKLIYLALMKIERKRFRPVATWRQALPQLVIMFGEHRVLGTNLTNQAQTR